MFVLTWDSGVALQHKNELSKSFEIDLTHKWIQIKVLHRVDEPGTCIYPQQKDTK